MEEGIRIFTVEDDPTYARFLKFVLELNPDFEITHYDKGHDCVNNLFLKPAIVILDYSLPDTSGEEVLREIKKFDPGIYVIIVSAQENVGTAIHLLKLGAFDYIIKNEDTKDLLLNAINNARKNVRLINEINYLKQELSEKYGFEKSIIGNSAALKKVFALLEKAVKTNITVSVTGETGTGKELIAKATHYNSPRKSKPFVPVNIAAIPRELIESELFGHEKGSFTGAVTRRIGKFEEAQGGTIFLDEIGEMDLALQAKLLRVIQEKELTRVGGNDVIKLDVRIIVATHKDLTEESRKGNFREDLYYRLLGLPIALPPLRDRGHDIIIIAKYMLQQFCQENQMTSRYFSSAAQEKLLGYNWPGNVRELKSVVELAAVMSNSEEISDKEIRFNAPLRTDLNQVDEVTLKEHTLNILRRMLDKYDHNVLKVADKLDIGKSTIYRYLKELESSPEGKDL